MKNPLDPSTLFSFQRNTIQRCFIQALPSRWCLCSNLCRNLSQEFLSDSKCSSHFLIWRTLSLGFLSLSVALPSSCYFPVNVLWMSAKTSQSTIFWCSRGFSPAKISGQSVHYLLPASLLELFWPANNGWEYRQFSCNFKQIRIILSDSK